MKRGIILILALVLFSSIAAAVNVDIDAIANHVLKEQNARFLVTIENDAFESKLFTIKSMDLNWMLRDSPIVKHLSGKSKDSYEVTFVPLKDLEPRIYGVSLIIISDKGDRVERFVPINLLRNEDVLNVEISSAPINPRKPATLSFKVNGKYDMTFEELYAKLTTNFFSKEFKFPLGKKGEHIEDFMVNLDPNQKSGSYPVRTLIKYGDYILVDKELTVRIGDYTNLKEIVNIEQGILTKKEIVKKINEGNAVIEETYSRDFSLAERLFSLMNPKPTTVKKNGPYYTLTWDLTVAPGEETDIILFKNYRDPLIILAIVALLGLFIYRWKVKVIRIQKKVMTLHTNEKDYITGMKVLISVKNKGGRAVKNLKIRERIPGLTKAPKHFGMLKPSAITHAANGVILTWEVGRLQVGEERLFTYRVEDKIHTVGSLALPPASVKYEDRNRMEIVYSNGINVHVRNQ